jgi:hypothetical protein
VALCVPAEHRRERAPKSNFLCSELEDRLGWRGAAELAGDAVVLEAELEARGRMPDLEGERKVGVVELDGRCREKV